MADGHKRIPKAQRDRLIGETKEIKTIRKAIRRLREQLSNITQNETCIPEPADVERITKAISICVKSIEDLKRDNAQRQQDIKESLHTPYVDYPPPSLEDRERFIARIRAAIPPLGDPRNSIHLLIEDAVRRYHEAASHMEPLGETRPDGPANDAS